MNGSPVTGLIRGWVDLYTRGMPAELRAARRDEIDDDPWCEHEEAAATGRSARSRDTDLALRLVFGIPADITWRLAYRGRATSIIERSPTMSGRVLGTLAIIGGLAFGSLLILFVPFGDSVWTGRFGVFGVLGTLVGAIAFAGAAAGLATQFPDRIGPLGALGALLAVLGAIGSMGGSTGLVTLLPIGSAMLSWDIGRSGVLPRRLSVVHAAAAIILAAWLVVADLAPADVGSRASFLALFTPYLLTWVAIGLSLLRGVPLPRATTG
jgi:hypothetical protein